jgi:hypothetical protein
VTPHRQLLRTWNPERIEYLAICTQCAAGFVDLRFTECPACHGQVRKLAAPISRERLSELRKSEEWQELRTVRAR